MAAVGVHIHIHIHNVNDRNQKETGNYYNFHIRTQRILINVSVRVFPVV